MPSAQSNARPATLVLLVIGLATALPSRASAADYDPDKGKSEIATLEATWHDRDRDRDVPVKIYYPKSPAGNSPAGRSPVIIFSHGLGGSREGYSYLMMTAGKLPVYQRKPRDGSKRSGGFRRKSD